MRNDMMMVWLMPGVGSGIQGEVERSPHASATVK